MLPPTGASRLQKMRAQVGEMSSSLNTRQPTERKFKVFTDIWNQYLKQAGKLNEENKSAQSAMPTGIINVTFILRFAGQIAHSGTNRAAVTAMIKTAGLTLRNLSTKRAILLFGNKINVLKFHPSLR